VAEIVPAIIAKDFEDLKNKIKLVEAFVKTVQLDIMDGVFVPNVTWPFAAKAVQDTSLAAEAARDMPFASVQGKPFVVPQGGIPQGKPPILELNNLQTNLYLEVHLMVAQPEEAIKEWSTTFVNRIIFHWEALGDFKSQISNIMQTVYRSGKQLGISLNPDTPLEVLDHVAGKIDFVLLMSVNPGFAGQKFIVDSIHRVAALRQKYPNVKIEVDGGVNLENAKQLIEAGADFLAVGSTIFESQNIEQIIKELSQISAAR
jgi:ribulose-phosphate 3-epimerase